MEKIQYPYPLPPRPTPSFQATVVRPWRRRTFWEVLRGVKPLCQTCGREQWYSAYMEQYCCEHGEHLRDEGNGFGDS